MADDIRIRVYPTVDKGQSASELSKVIADLEKNAKKIKVGIDDKELLAQIEKLKEQINSLTKGSNTKGNSKMFQGEAKSAKELVAEYKKLISEKDKLEKKMSKQTYQGQAYKALSKDLTKVNKDIESVGSKIDALNKKNIKSDITSSLNSSFESTIKKVTELGTSIENALGKRKLAGNQVADIKTLQNQVEKFKQEANLENILKADKPYAEMSKLITKADELSRSFKKLELSDNLSRSIRKAESDASILQNKIKSLYTKGYGDNNAIDKLFTRAKELSNINIRVNGKTAEADLINLNNKIKDLDTDYNKLVADMQRNKKMDVFKINVSASMKQLEELRTKFTSLGKDTSQIDSLKAKLEGLNKLTFAQAQEEFSKIKTRISEVSGEIPKATSAMNQFNKLMNERASLEKQMSKTTNNQSYAVLNKQLDENLVKIRNVSKELDALKNKNFEPNITKSLAATFNQLQDSATKTSQTIDNMFKNKNLTEGQISQLEALRKEMDRIKGTKLDNILNVSNSHETMATLLSDLQNVKNIAKSIEINGNFNSRLETAYKKVADIGSKISDLKNKGFTGSPQMVADIDKVVASYEKLKNVKININSDTAVSELMELNRSIEKTESEIQRLNNVAKANKQSFKIDAGISESLNRLEEYKRVIQTLGENTAPVLALEQKLLNLLELPYDEASTRLSQVNKEINKMIQNTTGIKSQTDALNAFNKAITQRDTLIKQLGKTPVGTETFKALESELGVVEGKINTIAKLLPNIKITGTSTETTKEFAKSFDNVQKSLTSAETKLNEFGSKTNLTKGQLQELQSLMTQLGNLKLTKFGDILSSSVPYNEMTKLIQSTRELENALSNLGKNINFTGKLDSQFNTAISKFKTLQSQMDSFKVTKMFGDTTQLDRLIQKADRLSKTKIDLDSEAAEADIQDLIRLANELENEFKQVKEVSKINEGNFNLETALKNANATLDQLQRKYQAMGKDVTPITNLRNQLNGLNGVSLKEADAQIRSVTSEARLLDKALRQTSNSSKQMSSAVATSAKKTSSFVTNLYSTLSTYSLGNILGMQITKGIYAIKETIVDLDSAFRDMEKVAPASFTGTKEELQEVKELAFQTGQDVARSSVDIINSTASAFQLGIDNVKQAMEYAKDVNMYANVADVNEETADKYLKTIASAYGGVTKSLEPMTKKVKGASDSYNMLTDYMDQANYAGECKLIAQ